MRVLLDTNILIDYIALRQPYAESAERIMFLCKNRQIHCCMAAHSVMNVFYILRKNFTVDERRIILKELCEIIEVISIEKSKIIASLENHDFSDMEDCLQSKCAEEFSADYIITRNIKDFQYSTIPAVLPDDFLHIINSDNNNS